MKRNLIMTQPLQSSFLSCERDTETILRKLFIESKPYSSELKRLLVVMNDDCLINQTNPDYLKVDQMSLKELIDQKYIILSPKVEIDEHQQARASIVMSFDNFTPNHTNTAYRDCSINFDVLCPIDHWDLRDYQQRPFKILGYIDGILNESKLSGIGVLNFLGCNGPVIDNKLGMFSLMYRAVHGSDDVIPDEEYNGV